MPDSGGTCSGRMHNAYTGQDYMAYFCPVCGHECEEIYLNKFGDPAGCEFCLTAIKSWTYCDE